ncbi:cyclodeaminase/cyclohydrolase family protein [Brachyspira hyodysenteriae]|nr:cyclodeaminase/cyclohydrolase family protein [Brachyspira hyodysenteriae]MCZ9840354.1 cyclodeaminase/cyclohydrolase family protein [Brachyspira hyodysenteriae]MCZ9848742.1 cyclodeaminase/cyclohydrolase family protein [Brachyspira hyodysenteriae]MCZ9872102.1 cyclodeaminase/cyclohydrolase family protein [Brachyspira hyodysenteriae]MCZ9930078.1 cyclodeaminase/cyclohydrolase family protein [Brachyspira hyodysenteriae]
MSKLIEKKLSDYINEVDSSLPAPGGGSVMGAVGSLACALAGMVGHLTVNKKKFLELSQEEQDNFNNAIENIRIIKNKLMEIVDKDAESFNAFMEAMKLPKNTEEEKQKEKLLYLKLPKKL